MIEITTAELFELLEDLAQHDLADGADINDHPCAIAIRKIMLLEDAAESLMAEPHGCPGCHSGELINKEKGHWDKCAFNKIGKYLYGESA